MTHTSITANDLAWAMGSACASSGKPFDPALLLKQVVPPYNENSLLQAATALGFQAKLTAQPLATLDMQATFVFVLLRGSPVVEPAPPQATPASVEAGQPLITLGLLVNLQGTDVTWIAAGQNTPQTEPIQKFAPRYCGRALLIQPPPEQVRDPDALGGANIEGASRPFGFKWFVPELLRHRKVWRDVLWASLVLQLLALGMPLFTQAIIDKVVVHRTDSTLLAIAIGMGIFMIATSVLSWVRQYLLLHTGNRVDAVLAASVFEHLFRLPPRYFAQRPTGVVAARLHGVETIREFVSSAAITLILDVPFLLIAVAIMFYYSVLLTLLALSILLLIVLLSALVAPIFQSRLNAQFMLGARNQAFLTEYIAGFETVKSLQFEPQLQAKYADYLAAYLNSGFKTKQIGNTYNVVASTLEQLMGMLILVAGAWIVMHPATEGGNSGGSETIAAVFTIGMLVAFQMFASKLSQPLMRLVGLWQQFQQARLAVMRLGDLMNAPAEPYSINPSRRGQGKGQIEVDQLAFRYAEDLPYLYENLSLTIAPGQVIALMGPSGSGKSTLAKLLLGFYWPTAGRIRIDGIDVRHLSANELRANFGVVPQETVLFSGTVYDNLLMANPHATFAQITQACQMAEIHTTIEALPQGYQTPIGERGAGLSGGQKQRLAIARALLKQPKVLIFDEATSALDAETAEHFSRTINTLRGKVTMLFITHALPASLRVDEVVQMSKTGARRLRAVPSQPSSEAEPA